VSFGKLTNQIYFLERTIPPNPKIE